jgi:alkanesulfonate monooxygenase SsuD/methylene tetrahydromethanopterin reductase-like flavin-dependent oxidoreductase (luciferase family)
MEIGLFTEFQSPPGMDEAQAFDEALAQVTAAETLGFDSVWLAEIHFQKGRSVLPPSSSPRPSPPAPAAASASPCRSFPCPSPAPRGGRVATVDHLSKGRLDFGGAGAGCPSTTRASTFPTRRGERFNETLEILVRRGRGALHPREILPVPQRVHAQALQKPHPPPARRRHYPGDVRDRGRMGMPIFIAVRTTSSATSSGSSAAITRDGGRPSRAWRGVADRPST